MNESGEIALVKQGQHFWSLPKGHVEAGETLRQAAEREIYEETGITDLVYIRDLGFYERTGGKHDDELKTIHFFLFTSKQKVLIPLDRDNPEAHWLPRTEITNRLTRAEDKAFFLGILKSI